MPNNYYSLKSRLIISASCIMLSFLAYAQKPKGNIGVQDIILSKNHFGITILSSVIQKANIQHIIGDYKLGATPQKAVEIGIKHHYNLNKSHSLIYGLTAGLMGRNFTLYIAKQDFNPAAKSDEDYSGPLSRDFDLVYFSLPVLFEKKWEYKKMRFFDLKGGINLRYSPQNALEINEGFIYNVNSELVKTFSMELIFNNENKPWLNYNVGSGHTWILGNNNIFKTELLLNLSFTKFVKGSYEITVPGQSLSKGTYGVKGSGVGLSLSYIFTGANARIAQNF